METVTDRQSAKQPIGVSLDRDDLEMLDRIRAHFGLESRSQAVRRSVRYVIECIDLDDPDGSIDEGDAA